jgi:hypothetical protein
VKFLDKALLIPYFQVWQGVGSLNLPDKSCKNGVQVCFSFSASVYWEENNFFDLV